jgi:predicted nucleic-acid-binding Zn-ribbon protein
MNCPHCHHHKFEYRPVTGNGFIKWLERVLVGMGIPTKWFDNLIVRCKNCKYFWRA